MKKYDAIIIGFGKAGKTLAGFLASKGKKVALIEKDSSMYGGTCINIGCIPTKILVEESERKEKTYSEAIEWKRTLTSKLRAANFNKLDALENVDIYNGFGSFVDQNTIKVETSAETLTLNTELIFINTGAKETLPNIEGINTTKNIYTSTTIMELSELPKQLVVVGGGYIGLEFSSIYNNFGSNVTILEGNEDILLKEETEIKQEIKNNFEQRKINILTHCKVKAFKNVNNNQVEITFEHNGETKTLVVDGVLIASGRKPYLDKLNLDNANVKYNEQGVVVNEKLQTNVNHIYALGDAKGGPQFTYVSLDDFRIIKNHLFGDKTLTTKDRKNLPFSLFISPTLSRVGLTEKEALEQGYKIKTKLLKVAMVPRAKILKAEQGLYKAIIEENTGIILGCSLYGIESSEIINIVSIAIKEKKHFSYLRDFIFTHPTMAESLNDLFDF